MKTAYLCGPMRGIPGDNFPQFHKAAALLRERGWTIISPTEMDTEAGEDTTTPKKRGQIDDHQVNRRIIRRDVEALLSLRAENGDAIIALPQWQVSVGTNAELRLSKWLGLELIQFVWAGNDSAFMLAPLELL